jgi:hypothetical protein
VLLANAYVVTSQVATHMLARGAARLSGPVQPVPVPSAGATQLAADAAVHPVAQSESQSRQAPLAARSANMSAGHSAAHVPFASCTHGAAQLAHSWIEPPVHRPRHRSLHGQHTATPETAEAHPS